jgi:hypothetical protein
MRKQGKTWVLRPKGPIPKGVRDELAARLLRHVTKRWTGRVRKVLLRFHGAYAYVAVIEAANGEKAQPHVCRYREEGEVPLELCRLGYLRSIDRWAYAFFKYSDECYAPSVVASGSFLATPEQAFDCAAGVYLHG